MKNLILTLILMIPLSGHASEVNLLAGRYVECVQWTTYNGVQTSKKAEFVFGEDHSLSVKISMFEGTTTCDKGLSEVYEYKNFVVVSDSGNRLKRIITAKNAETGLFFQFFVTKALATIYSGKTNPVQIEIANTMLLSREN